MCGMSGSKSCISRCSSISSMKASNSSSISGSIPSLSNCNSSGRKLDLREKKKTSGIHTNFFLGDRDGPDYVCEADLPREVLVGNVEIKCTNNLIPGPPVQPFVKMMERAWYMRATCLTLHETIRMKR